MITMRSERGQILKMLEEGKITAEEAMKLLDTVESQPAPPPRKNKFIRIRISGDDGEKVNVNLPIGLAKLAVRMASNFEPSVKEIDLDKIIEDVESGAEGRLLELQDGENKVEVYVE